MRFYTQTTSGPSPGIVIAGTKEDLASLGQALASAVTKVPARTISDGSILLEDFEVHGDPWDWITFRIDSNIEHVLDKNKRKAKRSHVFVTGFYTFVIVILYLAGKGLISFFK
jgi:hypothetical protein